MIDRPVEAVNARRKDLIIYWLPAAAWMLLIFILSSQPNPGRAMPVEVRNEITREIPEVYDSARGWRPLSINELAHPLEYTLLAVLLARALAGHSFHGLRNSSAAVVAGALILSVLYALLDELQQVFVPARTFQRQDLALDLLGALMGLLLVGWFSTLRHGTAGWSRGNAGSRR